MHWFLEIVSLTLRSRTFENDICGIRETSKIDQNSISNKQHRVEEATGVKGLTSFHPGNSVQYEVFCLGLNKLIVTWPGYHFPFSNKEICHQGSIKQQRKRKQTLKKGALGDKVIVWAQLFYILLLRFSVLWKYRKRLRIKN